MERRVTHDFNDIVMQSLRDAENVLDNLRRMVSRYSFATVGNLYDLVGLTGDFKDDKWGWRDLKTASVCPVQGGFTLNLPPAHNLEDPFQNPQKG